MGSVCYRLVWHGAYIVVTKLGLAHSTQGLDLPDIQVVVQWKVPASLNTIWQRFGRGARAEGTEADAVLIAEKHHFDDERAEKEARNAHRRATAAKRKKKQKGSDSPVKRRALADTEDNPVREPPVPPLQSDLPVAAGSGSGVEVPEEESDVEVDNACDGGEGQSGNPASMVEVKVVDFDERRAVYNKRVGPTATTAKSASQKEEKAVHPAIDDFINADLRGFKCRCKPIALAYSNDE